MSKNNIEENIDYSTDSTRMYLKEIGKYPILSTEDQKKLGRLMVAGDTKAREQLINCNLRLVVSVAKQFAPSANSFQLLDIIQEGNSGLLRAIETYEPELGAFTTYAQPWVEQHIKRGLANKDDEIRKPVHIKELTHKYNEFIEKYIGENRTFPTDEQICSKLKISKKTLKTIRDSFDMDPISLNQIVKDDSDTELGDFVSVSNDDYNDILNDMTKQDIFIVVKEVLSPLKYFVVYHRILSENRMTLEEVAPYLNITRERVRQLEAKALKQLKPYFKKDSRIYQRKISEIRDREGIKYNRLKIEPIEPFNIVKYMYLKDDLSDIERKLYKMVLLGKYNYTDNDYVNAIGVSFEQYQEIKKSLIEKINEKFSDKMSFDLFQHQMIKSYGTKIFDLDLTKKEKIIDYKTLKEEYSELDLDEILEKLNRVDYKLNPKEEKLITRYFGSDKNPYLLNTNLVEKEINALKYGFKRKSTSVSLEKLYKHYLTIKDKYNDEQKAFIESYVFRKKDKALFRKEYPNSTLYPSKAMYVNALEKSYYNINAYFQNEFTKENWLEVREKYRYRFTDFRVEVLDLFYGVNTKPYSLKELSEKYNMDPIKMHDIYSNARDLAINLFYGINLNIHIDKSIYAPYIDDIKYNYTEETRRILRLFIIEDKTYDEISKITGLTNTRISNIITEAIRKIDNYRFNLIKSSFISKEELNEVFNYYKDKFSETEKSIIILKYAEQIENKNIAELQGQTLLQVNQIVRKFNMLYEDYLVRNVVLTQADITSELSKHACESVLSVQQKEVISMRLGFKNKYNPKGIKLTEEEIKSDKRYPKNICNDSIKILKLHKIGYKTAETIYIPRSKLNVLLNDVHLPISEKEREIICHLLALKNYTYMTLDELAKKYGEKRASIKRRYQRAIVSIYKYINKEIDGNIDYDTDIAPILKYFGNSDRNKIEDFYKNRLTYEELAEKYNLSFDKIVAIMNRLKQNVNELLTNPNAKKFDFDYYQKVVNNPDLPFNGNIELATKIFDLAFGMNEERISLPAIKERLNLECATSVINKTIYNIMISVCKYKDGIKKNKTFPLEQVIEYYQKNYNNMPDYIKREYERYINAIKKDTDISGSSIRQPYIIISDLIQDVYPDAFKCNTATKEEVEELLKQYNGQINKRVRTHLMECFDIPERKFMNGRDINHVYKILCTLDNKLKSKEVKDKTLIKTKNR